MWNIVFICYGLYCGSGQDLQWFGKMIFESKYKCEIFAIHVLEHAIPPKDMSIDYQCSNGARI